MVVTRSMTHLDSNYVFEEYDKSKHEKTHAKLKNKNKLHYIILPVVFTSIYALYFIIYK